MIAFEGCRFVRGSSCSIPGYLEVKDYIQNKTYLGRLLPRVDPVGQNLEFWTGLRHPSFLFIPRFWIKEGQFMVLLEHLEESRSLRDFKAQSLSVIEIGGLFGRLLNALAFLEEYHLALPRLDLARLYYHSEKGLKLTGHETACRVEGVFSDPEMVHFDMRYSPPEWLSDAVPHERSGVYYAAALFYHFLTRQVHKPELAYVPVTKTFRRLKKGWDDLLSRMLTPDPEKRPTFADACHECLKLVGSHGKTKMKRDMLAFLPFNDAKTTKLLTHTLISSGVGARMVLLETCPGVELVRRLSPLITFARSSDYLVLQTWNANKSGIPFKTVNDVIRQLGESVLPDLGLGDLAAEFLPLSEWQDSNEMRQKWPSLLARLMSELGNQGIQGILMIVEDVQNLDKASLAALIEAAAFVESQPVMFAFTCDTLTSPECGVLREKWPWNHSIIQAEEDASARLTKCVWTPSRSPGFRNRVHQNLAVSGGNEILFLKRMHPLHPLRGKEYQAFLKRIWENLSAKEQLVFKLLVCSFRALDYDEMETAFSVKNLDSSADHLQEFSMVTQDAGGGLKIRNLAMGEFCDKNMSPDEKAYIWNQLLDFEKRRRAPDPVQIIFLALNVDQTDLAEVHISAQMKTLSEIWDTRSFDALARVSARTNAVSLRPLNAWSKLLHGIPVSSRERHLPSVLKNWSSCLKKATMGDFDGAAHGFLKLTGNRSNTTAQKAFFLFQSAHCASANEDTFWVSKCWRRFEKLDLSPIVDSVCEEWMGRFAAIMISSGNSNYVDDIDVSSLPEALRAWVDAHHAYAQSQFIDSIKLLELALPYISRFGDLNWVGDAFKMYGNALYRNNQVPKAITAYQKSRSYYERANNQIGLDNLNFNLATSEKLAGRFVSAINSFAPVLEKAKARSDQLTECQIYYNLSVIALMQFDDLRFREISDLHLRLARRVRDAAERVRGLSLRLHASLVLSKAEVVELIAELEQVLKKGSVDGLLADEADVALRLAYFSVGKVYQCNQTPHERFTAWRHRFVDFLQGDERRSFPDLLEKMGSGLFRCYHLLMIKTAVEAGLIPQRLLTQELADAYTDLAKRAGARVRSFLKTHMPHLRTMGDVPRSNWERAIQSLESVRWWDTDSGAMTTALVDELKHVWPFDGHGFSVVRRGRWEHLDEIDDSFDGAEEVNRGLGLMDARLADGPVMTTLWRAQGSGALDLLVLPFRLKAGRRAAFWAVHEAAERDVSLGFFEPLYRFYAKLLEYAVGIRMVDAAAHENPTRETPPKRTSAWGIVGQSQAIVEVHQQIQTAGPTDLNMFISGESGTGKELVARALHQASNRAHKPFRAINCSHFPETLIESQLFGHVKGSFTGATGDRIGFLELADGGTLFLDEVGDLHPKTQSFLLRVIQEGEFSRIGESRIRRVNLRFVTATNKNIHALIDQAVFRKDLFFRIAEEELRLPPLRYRTEDFSLLAKHFAKKHKPQRSVFFCRTFFDELRQYSWPGNVREFESYIRRVLSRFAQTESFTQKHVLPFLMGHGTHREEDQLTLDELERRNRREILQKRLVKFGGNRTKTAQSLGISRQRIAILIKQFHLG